MSGGGADDGALSVQHLTDRHAALLLFALLFDGARAGELVEGLPKHAAAALGPYAQTFLTMPTSQRAVVVVREIRQRVARRGAPLPRYVHPGWIEEALTAEPPHVQALILTQLSTSFAIEYRRKAARRGQTLPTLEQSSSGDTPALLFLVRRFLQPFQRYDFSALHPLDRFNFASLWAVVPGELGLIVDRAGLDELALALRALGKAAMARFLRRLPQRDARLLIDTLRAQGTASAHGMRLAQKSLVRSNLGGLPPERYVRRVGLQLVGEALGDAPAEPRRNLCLALDPWSAARVTEILEGGDLDRHRAARARNRLLRAFETLRDQGLVGRLWASVEIDYEEVPVEEPSAGERGEAPGE